ncbi:hypothetical protein [Alloactinosynnema sp. L-07]|uniref:DUF6292 family protein n=1 Tax=Alloactinosynnema sp. L-07 TaxID=1653480 RepID=UPI00065EF7FF|nr:DUF6292 family protein [Alloactinosynnema sp. L-07]CRK61056.1 hypothetical protein [Alloactinosynnema sp. L-07]
MEDHATPSAALSRGLAGYLRAVADTLGVPAEATSFEISDTATAYLGLARRWAERPDQDLMLVWSERHGWALAVETDPTDAAEVVAYLDSADVVPKPSTVAEFVADVLSGRGPDSAQPVFPVTAQRHQLAERLKRYA